MNIESIIYGALLVTILIVLIVLIIFINEKPEYTTRFYKYRIKYDVNLDKYYSMLKKQKIVIFKKKIELLYLKVLLKLKKGI
ncbi:MAG: hypothetical protein IJY25_01625 [Bacilli bacterium]|nr:hypothetical protein [Bacilli bacterium]